MNRRDFLTSVGAATVAALVPTAALAGPRPDYSNLLILIELKGGNDGLNTVIPYSSGEYYSLRPRIAIPRDQVLQLDSATGLHPALEPLMPLWRSRELAIVQGMGYPSPNLSHFRSIEIWDTAANSSEYLNEGWLTRAFVQTPPARSFAADGVIVGAAELGPMAGSGTRAIALTNPEQFIRQARFAAPTMQASSGALRHILKVESDIVHAAAGITADYPLQTEFAKTPFGNAIRTAAQVVASKAGVAAIKVSLNGFDTHSAQQGTQARLLKDLAEGLAALKSALVETGRWQSSLILTYAEFGRRPAENQSGGTDHGTASAHFVLGGRVKGGLYGEAPSLNGLDGNGNLARSVDFRELYATVLERWWGTDSAAVLRGRYTPLDLVRA
ncbi:MAG: Twin-arginine translocation pathway signal sequence protein [Betaproteobacteria bacterium]|nr:Twin-arginine translocation pathway signal sequence protein [Betaproteobacteria bacterium]